MPVGPGADFQFRGFAARGTAEAFSENGGAGHAETIAPKQRLGLAVARAATVRDGLPEAERAANLGGKRPMNDDGRDRRDVETKEQTFELRIIGKQRVNEDPKCRRHQ